MQTKKIPIGEIPEDWEVVELGNPEYFEVIMGQSPPSSSYNQEGRGMPFIQGAAEFGHVYVTPKLFTTKPLKIAKKGDILLSVRAPVGEVNIAPFDLCIGRGVGAIHPNPKKVDGFFLYYRMSVAKKELERLGGGAVFKAITKNTLKSFKIPLPPLPEQKKIAEILRTVDDAIEKTDLAIEKTERLKKGLMQRLLTKGIKHERFKKTEIGKIPEEWRVVRLGEIAELKSGGTPSRKKPEYWENGTIPWVKSGELNDDVIYDTEEKITERAVKESSAKIFPKGTLLFALYGRGTVGKTAILGIDAATNQAVCGIFPKNNTFIPKFMQYYLIYKREQILTQYVNPSSDVGRTNIYISSLALLKIPLPPLEEQKQIAEILSIIDKKLELLRKRKEKLERVKRGLMKDLLTGRRRVKT
ncbi:restriction endonuclease subunit S [Thermococcus sp.]